MPPSVLARYWRLHPRTIVHVGAHEAEEADAYIAAGWGDGGVVWLEAQPDKAEILRQRFANSPKVDVVEGVAWDATGLSLAFHVTSNSQSSSALTPKDHLEVYPDIIISKKLQLNSLALADIPTVEALDTIGLINLDIQGAELRALRGLGDLLDKVQAVYSEVNTRELYEGCATFSELDTFLTGNGFTLVDWQIHPQGWGDALWLRKPPSASQAAFRRSARIILSGAVRLRERIKAKYGLVRHKHG